MTKDEFILAYLQIQQEVGSALKDSVNSFHKYKYTSAESVIKMVRKACNKAGLMLVASVSIADSLGENARASANLTLTDGDNVLHSSAPGEGSDKGDKATMKASTAAYKYALRHMFCIDFPDELDPEADSGVDESAATKQELTKAIKATTSSDGLKAVKTTYERMRDKMTNADQRAVLKAYMTQKEKLT